MGGDGRPQGDGGDGHGDGVGHGESLEVLKLFHEHDFTKGFMAPNLTRKSVSGFCDFA